MAASEKTGGTQTATVTTLHTLATVTDAGTYALSVDVSVLVGGATPDILELTLEKKVRSTSTAKKIHTWTIGPGVQSDSVWESPPFICPHGITAKLKQVQGTSRNFEWAIVMP